MSFSQRALIDSLNLGIHHLTNIEKSLTYVHDAISKRIHFLLPLYDIISTIYFKNTQVILHKIIQFHHKILPSVIVHLI